MEEYSFLPIFNLIGSVAPVGCCPGHMPSLPVWGNSHLRGGKAREECSGTSPHRKLFWDIGVKLREPGAVDLQQHTH